MPCWAWAAFGVSSNAAAMAQTTQCQSVFLSIVTNSSPRDMANAVWVESKHEVDQSASCVAEPRGGEPNNGERVEEGMPLLDQPRPSYSHCIGTADPGHGEPLCLRRLMMRW